MVPFHLHALVQAKTRATRITTRRTRVASVGTALASRSHPYSLRARGATRAAAPRVRMVVRSNGHFPRLIPRPSGRSLPLFSLLRHHLRRRPESPLAFRSSSSHHHHHLACSSPIACRRRSRHLLLACSCPIACHHRALARRLCLTAGSPRRAPRWSCLATRVLEGRYACDAVDAARRHS